MPFEPLKFLINQVKTAVGNLTNLKTPQPDVVTALNAHTDQIGDLETAVNTKDGLDYIGVNLSSLGVNLTNNDNGIYYGYYDISALLPSGVSGTNIVGVTLVTFREFVWFNVSHQYLVIHASRAMNYANFPNDGVRIWYRR